MTLIWSDRAIRHLNEIITYINKENPVAAKRIAERVITLAKTSLRDQPQIGRPGRVTGTQELVVTQTPYIIAYRQHGTEITILAVIHRARKWPLSL